MNATSQLVALSEAELSTVTGGDYVDDLNDAWNNPDADPTMTADTWWQAFDNYMDFLNTNGFNP